MPIYTRGFHKGKAHTSGGKRSKPNLCSASSLQKHWPHKWFFVGNLSCVRDTLVRKLTRFFPSRSGLVGQIRPDEPESSALQLQWLRSCSSMHFYAFLVLQYLVVYLLRFWLSKNSYQLYFYIYIHVIYVHIKPVIVLSLRWPSTEQWIATVREVEVELHGQRHPLTKEWHSQFSDMKAKQDRWIDMNRYE